MVKLLELSLIQSAGGLGARKQQLWAGSRTVITLGTQGYDGPVEQACFTSTDNRQGTHHAARNLSASAC